MNGSAQTGPIGSRAAPVKPASDDEEDELLPDRHAAVADGFRLDVGAGQRLVDRAHAVGHPRQLPNTSPKTMRRCVPVCSITPGPLSAVAM